MIALPGVFYFCGYFTFYLFLLIDYLMNISRILLNHLSIIFVSSFLVIKVIINRF